MDALKATLESARLRSAGRTFQPDICFLKAVQTLEFFGAACPLLGGIYSRLFYKKLLQNELRMSEITPEMNVIHIGCGALPMTAMFLAEYGVRVTAVDMEDGILRQASRTVFRYGLCDRIKLIKNCGTLTDYSGFDAVWLSLHVRPMDFIVRRALKNMDKDAVIILRGGRGRLKRFYRDFDHHRLDGSVKWKEVRQPLGKKSIMLKNA